MAAATTPTKLLPRAAAVVMKTPAATAMAGAQTTIKNKQKLLAAMATEMATMTATMTNEKKMTAAVVAAWQQRSGNGGGSTALAAAAAQRRLQQRGRSLAVMAAAWR